jgi:hypothetical protein
MWGSPGKTWQVTEDSPTDLLIALYLRDAAGLLPVGHPVLPPIEPSLAPLPSRTPRESLATGQFPAPSPTLEPLPQARFDELRKEWEAWWGRLVRPTGYPRFWELEPPEFTAFADSPELRQLLRERFREARRWAGRRHEEFGDAAVERIHRGDHDVNAVVVACERELGRRAEPFHLDVLVLPLADSDIWVIGPSVIVVSTRLRNDSPAFRDALTPLVHALA